MAKAIERIGGGGALARALGVPPASVCAWRCIPAEHVATVEALTGVARSVLRPDLYPHFETPATAERDETDVARAEEYALIGALLLRPPDSATLAHLSRLEGNRTSLGNAHAALAGAAADASADTVAREYFDLFIGVGRGELLPYASYYLTGFLYERPLARLRTDLKRLGLERAEDHFDPEDHLGTLCEIMSGLASGHFGASVAERDFFNAYLAPWSGRFFADLEKANFSKFYKAVGTLGRVFIDIESEGFMKEAPEAREAAIRVAPRSIREDE